MAAVDSKVTADVTTSTATLPAVGNEPAITFKKRAGKPKANFRKRPATPPPASDSDSEYSSQDEDGRRVKKRKRAGVVTASSAVQRPSLASDDDLGASKFEADRTAIIESSNDATKQSNWFDEGGKDALSAQQLLGKARARPSSEAGAVAETADGGVYKGAANYRSFIEKNPNAPDRHVGPVKAPTNIRTITVTDYAPDTCKDFKISGYCGYGDSCKFAHSREDYKQGWQLDRDWEIGTKGKKLAGQTVASANRGAKTDEDKPDEEEALLEKIPFACIICKKPYTNPIVTRCGHYFCEACAIQRYRKTPTCVACGTGTGGVFNGAKNLRKLLDKKRERERKRQEADGGLDSQNASEEKTDGP